MSDAVEFEWDDGNRQKCQKHGVPIKDVEGVFLADPLILPDLMHSKQEERLVAVGLSPGGRMIFVGFTVRRRDTRQLVRPITARYMRDKEFLRYAKTSP